MFVETFETINWGHLKPPPPSPPTPPTPPPSPLPPVAPFPPGLPPIFGDPIRVFSPLAFDAPEADVDGLFAITCAVEHCGDGLPIFKSSSQIGIVAKVTAMAESGSLFRSACAYECARTVTSHALGLDDFTQLFTTSTLPSAFFSYPRLSVLQESVLSEAQTDGDGNLGASSQGVTEGTFSPLERIAVEHNLTMQECGVFFEERKNIAMHAVWLYNDDTTELAIGDCSLFLAARSTFQHTLWDSFFEHARRVTTIGHFETAVPNKDHVAVARPPTGEDCNFDHQTFGGTASAGNTDTTWRACVWWSEFQSDVQDELACSPDRDGSNVLSPNELLANLRDSRISYPPPSPPPPPPPSDNIPPSPSDQNFRCAAGMLPRTSPEQSAPRCWEWNDATDATAVQTLHATVPYSHDSGFWPPFAVHGDVFAEDVGGCRQSPPPAPPSPPPPPGPSSPPPPSPSPLPPPPPGPQCTQKALGNPDCVKFYVLKDTTGQWTSMFDAWNQCMQPGQSDTRGRAHARRGLPAIWWGSAAHATEFWGEVEGAMASNDNKLVAVSINDICQESEYNAVGLRNKIADPTKGWIMDYWRGPHEATSTTSVGDACEISTLGFGAGACASDASSYVYYARQRMRWLDGEPNNRFDEDCAAVENRNGGIGLNDVVCNRMGERDITMVACMTTDGYIDEQTVTRTNVVVNGLYPSPSILFDDFQTREADPGQDPISWLWDNANFGARGRYYATQPIDNDNGQTIDTELSTGHTDYNGYIDYADMGPSDVRYHCSGGGTAATAMAPTATIGMRLADENGNQVVLDSTAHVWRRDRRLQETDAVTAGVSRLVQWDTTFRQPSFADRASSEPFTGPTFADCSDSDVPDTHCCRARTAFWVSNDATDAKYYKPAPNDDGRVHVTGCRDVCGTNFLRYGEDTQCVPVLPECNDWDGAQSLEFEVSDLLLLEAYCLCGMKRAVVPVAAERRLSTRYNWPEARGASIDSVTGGHFGASDQCYASSINFHTRLYAENDRRCPTTGGDVMLYTEMTATDIKFARNEAQSAYAACDDTSTDPLDCCVVNRSDAMATHYYNMRPLTLDVHPFSQNSASVAFGRGMPFGTSPSQSRLVFTFDFDRDGTEDIVVGNRMYLSRSVESGTVQNWAMHRHTGKRFTSGTPLAMDAVVVGGLNKIFVSIAYDDNSVILYSYDMPSTSTVSLTSSQVVLHWERTLDQGDRGDVTALQMTQYATDSTRRGLHGIEHVGIYVSYHDADDVIHNIDYPRVDPAAGISGFVPEYSIATPKVSTTAAQIVPSLAVDLVTLDDAYAPSTRSTMSIFGVEVHVYDAFFVATPNGFPNIVVLDHTGFEERAIPNTDTSNSVAVSSVAIATANETTTHTTVVLVCFANTNTQNTCHRLVSESVGPGNMRLDYFNMQSSRSHAFGDFAEVTTDIFVTDINLDKFLDVITIEGGGYVRIYRGSYHTQQTGDFSDVVPEPLDASAAASNRRRANSINPGGILGTEKFMANAKLGIGRCASCTRSNSSETTILSRNERDYTPIRYILAHYYAPEADAGSCSMRCHHAGRIGFDSFQLYANSGIESLDTADLDAYYAMGEPTQCLCGPRFDALKKP